MYEVQIRAFSKNNTTISAAVTNFGYWRDRGQSRKQDSGEKSSGGTGFRVSAWGDPSSAS